MSASPASVAPGAAFTPRLRERPRRLVALVATLLVLLATGFVAGLVVAGGNDGGPRVDPAATRQARAAERRASASGSEAAALRGQLAAAQRDARAAQRRTRVMERRVRTLRRRPAAGGK
jgi:hypothetical protein